MIEKKDLQWSAIRNETHLVVTPFEYVSRRVLFGYQQYASVKILIALSGFLAILVSVFELTDRSEDRRIQSLLYFNEIKSSSGSSAVNRQLKDLREDGILFEEIPTSGSNLDSINFDNENITKANFSSSQIKFASFKNCKIVETHFDESYLNGTSFESSDFHNVFFTNSKLAYTNFKGMTGKNVKFTGAFLFGSDMSNIDCSECDFTLIQGSVIDFSNANLLGSSFWRAQIDEANFSSANLSGVQLHGAELRNAKFDNANISGTVFEDYVSDELYSADVSPEQLKNACVDEEDPILPRKEGFEALKFSRCPR